MEDIVNLKQVKNSNSRELTQFTQKDLELLSEPEDPPGNLSIPRVIEMARRKKILVLGLAIGLALQSGMKAYKQIPDYESTFQILVQPVTEKNKLSSLTGEKGGGGSNKEFDYTTQIEVLLSPAVLQPIVKDINKKFPEVTIDDLNSNLSVYRLGETKAIEIKYVDENPEKVKVVLQATSKGFLKYSAEEQEKTLRQGIEFVEAQLPDINRRVNRLQNELLSLRKRFGFIDPDDYSKDLYNNLSGIAQKRQSLRLDIETSSLRYETLKKKLGTTILLADSPKYQEFLAQFQALDRQIAIELARFGENSPTIKMLRKQQDNLIPLLQAEARRSINNQLAKAFNEISLLKSQDESLAKIEKNINRKYQQMPQVSKVYNALERDLKVANESLGRFIEAREALEIEAAQNQVPWQLIRPPASPSKLAKGSVEKGLISGFLAGLVASLVISYLLEIVEGKFYTLYDLRRKTNLPILGTIPFRKDLKSLGTMAHVVDWRPLLQPAAASNEALNAMTEDVEQNLGIAALDKPILNGSKAEFPPPLPEGSTYDFLESFRTLNTFIGRVRGNPDHWALAVSSASAREGRTTVAIHLAQAAAAMGHRVLLVDAHFHRNANQASSFLGIGGQAGLGDFLMGKCSIKQVIRFLSWENNLFFINAGTSPPDPTRALASQRMQEFMSRVRETFDIVIYDTPPLMGLADLGILSAHTDGVLFVVKFGKWGTSSALNQALDRLKLARIPVLGIVANAVKQYSVQWYRR